MSVRKTTLGCIQRHGSHHHHHLKGLHGATPCCTRCSHCYLFVGRLLCSTQVNIYCPLPNNTCSYGPPAYGTPHKIPWKHSAGETNRHSLYVTEISLRKRHRIITGHNLQLGLESSVGSTETQRKHTSSSSTCLGRPIRAVLNAGHICLLFPLPIPFILTIMNCTSSCRYRTALVGSHGHSFMPFCQAPCSHPKGLLFSETLLLLFHGYKTKTCQD